METSQGIFGRLGEKVLGWIALLLIVFIGIAIYRMPAETKAAVWSGIWRTAAWVAIAAALPWSSRLFIRRALEAGSNWTGVGLMGALIGADIIAGLLLMTGWPSGGWSWFICLAALGVVGTYNYLVSEYLSEQTGL